MEQRQAELGPVSDTDLAELVAARRQELGISPDPNPLERVLSKLKAPLTPEQQRDLDSRRRAQDQWEAEQALVRQRQYRDGAEMVLQAKAGGDRFSMCRFSTYRAKTNYQKRVLATVENWAETLPDRKCSSESLVLYGPVGTGKDHLAFACCRMAIQRHGMTVEWINGMDWFGRIRDAIDDAKAASEEELIRKLTVPDLLCVSDPLPPFGSLTQHQAAMLYRLVNARYAAGKLCICTVNVADDAEADSRIGAATWDRLCDSAWKVFMNWPSHRKPVIEVAPEPRG